MLAPMKTLSMVLLLGGLALAQPPGPPGPPPGGGPNIPTGASSGGGAANLSFPHVVGKLSGYSPNRFTIQRELSSGGPTANMDFRVATGAFLAPGLKSGDRAIVVYQMNPNGEGYQALGVIGFPTGSDPTAAIKGMPKLK